MILQTTSVQLFALLRTTGVSRDPEGLVVRRLQLSADLQDAVAAYAEEWRQAFLGRDVETIPFDGRYTPDAPEEVLEVTPFVLPAVIVKAVDSPLSVEVLALDGDTPERVSALFVGSQMKHGPEVLLQAFDRRRFISTFSAFLKLPGSARQK